MELEVERLCAAFVPQRLDGQQLGRPARRIDATHSSQHNRREHPLTQQGQRELALQETQRSGLAQRADQGHAGCAAQQPANQSQPYTFTQDEDQDALPAPAERPQRADLARALEHTHHHGVGHAHAADDDGQQRNAPRETLDHAHYLLLVRGLRRVGHGQAGKLAFQPRAHSLELPRVFELDLDGAHLTLFLD